MDIYYIYKDNDTLELIVERCENREKQETQFQEFSEFLQDVAQLSNDGKLGIAPFEIINILPSQFKITIKNSQSFLYNNSSTKSARSLLEINRFHLISHEDNKLKVYYIQKNDQTLELFFDGEEKQEKYLKGLRRFLQFVPRANYYPCTITEYLPLEFKITIKSPYLFKDAPPAPNLTDHDGPRSSIISCLILNGYKPIHYQFTLPQESFFNKVCHKLKLR
ncbi:MAG: hypothetical protein ABSA84_04290 [Gammaproteobacteria bacterium]